MAEMCADPMAYEETFEGFAEYLTAIGAKHVSAKELLSPHKPKVAEKLGYEWLLPPREMWSNLEPLIEVFEQMRALVNEPIAVRNWWRPADYNAEVGGAKRSDHISGHAFDCDFKSRDSRAKAEELVERLQDERDDLQLSLGFGAKTIHLGAKSPKGRRTWYYDSYKR
jgi:hypothetical protein